MKPIQFQILAISLVLISSLCYTQGQTPFGQEKNLTGKSICLSTEVATIVVDIPGVQKGELAKALVSELERRLQLSRIKYSTRSDSGCNVLLTVDIDTTSNSYGGSWGFIVDLRLYTLDPTQPTLAVLWSDYIFGVYQGTGANFQRFAVDQLRLLGENFALAWSKVNP